MLVHVVVDMDGVNTFVILPVYLTCVRKVKMIQVRQGVFETNSSSTHSICISKKPVDVSNGAYIDFHMGKFGWFDNRVNAADYLYTAIMCLDGDDGERLQRLKDVLDSHDIRYEFETPLYDEWGIANGYIDHYDETEEFVDSVLNDEDLLMRCLFGDSCVYTGSDNYNEDDDMCYVAYDDHPKHDSDNYDYFFKGN